MTDEEYEKLVDQFDDFLRAWEKNYLKENPKKKIKQKRKSKSKPKSDKDFTPPFEDIAEYMSLDDRWRTSTLGTSSNPSGRGVKRQPRRRRNWSRATSYSKG